MYYRSDRSDVSYISCGLRPYEARTYEVTYRLRSALGHLHPVLQVELVEEGVPGLGFGANNKYLYAGPWPI